MKDDTLNEKSFYEKNEEEQKSFKENENIGNIDSDKNIEEKINFDNLLNISYKIYNCHQ